MIVTAWMNICVGDRNSKSPSSGGVRDITLSEGGLWANYYISHVSVSVFVVTAKQTPKEKKNNNKKGSLALNVSFFFFLTLPGSWNGTKAKLYKGFFGLLRDVSSILDAPSMTCTRSSYMEPVTSKTNARVDAPSGIASFVAAGTPASCPAQKATDSVRYSHSNLQPISELRCFTAKVVLGSRCVSVCPGLTQDTLGSRKRGLVCVYAFQFLCTFCCSLSPRCELKACNCKLALPVVCRVRSLFNPVIQRPPLSWAVSQAQNHPCWIALLWLDKTFLVTSGDSARKWHEFKHLSPN